MSDVQSITCPDCGMTSYNPNDIEQRYCGNCHKFHDAPSARRIAPDWITAINRHRSTQLNTPTAENRPCGSSTQSPAR